MKTPVILLVDDEASIVNSMKGSLEDDGFIVLTAFDGIRALEIVKSQPVDMVFLDIWLPEMDGMETLKAIKDFNTGIEVVMMTGHGTVNTAVQAVKQGAFEFLEKPFSLDTVIDIVKKITEKSQASGSSAIQHEQDPSEDSTYELTGKNPLVLEVKKKIPGLASSGGHVLLQGEVGTGREIVARMLHASSSMKNKAMIKFNCAFYGSDDMDMELFGSRSRSEKCKQASDSPGVLQETEGGMIYLSAIDSMPMKTQKHLAGYLSAQNDKSPKVRVIASSVLSIDNAIESKQLLKDLADAFTEVIEMPSLRNRRSDIPLLLKYFIEFYCDDYGFRIKNIEDDALESLINYDWPGNVKELKNLVEKLIVSVPTKNITVHDIPASLRDDIQYNMARYYERYRTMEEAEAAWRRNYLLYHLRKNNRSTKKTAKKLYIKEKSLIKYIKDYGIVLTHEKKSGKRYQRTLKRSMVLSGRGLHSGDKTGLILTPLPPNSGIFFGNISSGETVPADINYVSATGYATCLENSGAVARTVEHFLAVLHAYRITNLMIKINNELPIMDGSAVDFCQIIEDAGIEEQDETTEEVVIKKRYSVGEVKKKSKFIMVEPSEKFSINYTLNYPKPVGRQEYTFVLEDEESFKKEIAPARTFGFLKEIEALGKEGLGEGGRLNNFILIDDEKIINTDLRFPDEFVRHKILDMIGDLYLLGRPIRGKFTANMTGHTENTELVRLLRDKMNL